MHTLWAGGMAAIEELVPGVEGDRIAAGGCRVEFWSDFQWLLPVNRWSTRWPRRSSGQSQGEAAGPLPDGLTDSDGT